MRRRLIILLLLLATGPASADTFRAGGVGAATKLLPRLFAAFDHKGDELEVIAGLGTSGGIKALEANVLDFAVAGRHLSDQETKQGLRIALAIRTPFVLATSHPKPNDLKGAEVPGIFASPNSTWADGSPLRVVLRPQSDSDTPLLAAMFPGMAQSMDVARKRQDVPIAATDQDNASLGESIGGSLVATTLTQIQTERRNLRLVSIDGVSPSLETVATGAYRFSKTLYFVLPARENPAVERFLAFLKSQKGKELLRDTGNIVTDDEQGRP